MENPIVKIEFKSEHETFQQVYDLYIKNMADFIMATSSDKETQEKLKWQLGDYIAMVENNIFKLKHGRMAKIEGLSTEESI